MIKEAMSPSKQYQIAFEDEESFGTVHLISIEDEVIIASMRVYNALDPPLTNQDEVYLIWSDNSTKCGLVINDELWAMFDLSTRKMRTIDDTEDIHPLDKGLFFVGLHGNMGEPFSCYDLEIFELN